MSLHVRIRKFAVVILWYPANPWLARWNWGVHKWSYKGESSWRHGVAWLGKIKIIW